MIAPNVQSIIIHLRKAPNGELTDEQLMCKLGYDPLEKNDCDCFKTALSNARHTFLSRTNGRVILNKSLMEVNEATLERILEGLSGGLEILDAKTCNLCRYQARHLERSWFVYGLLCGGLVVAFVMMLILETPIYVEYHCDDATQVSDISQDSSYERSP